MSRASMPKPTARPFLEVDAPSSLLFVANETIKESGAVRSILSAEFLMDSCMKELT